LRQFRSFESKNNIRSFAYYKTFTAYEWLFVIRYGLPLISSLGVPDRHLQLLADAFVLTLKWCSPQIKRSMLQLMQEKYTTLMRQAKEELELSSCDLNYHVPVQQTVD